MKTNPQSSQLWNKGDEWMLCKIGYLPGDEAASQPLCQTVMIFRGHTGCFLGGTAIHS